MSAHVKLLSWAASFRMPLKAPVARMARTFDVVPAMCGVSEYLPVAAVAGPPGSARAIAQRPAATRLLEKGRPKPPLLVFGMRSNYLESWKNASSVEPSANVTHVR